MSKETYDEWLRTKMEPSNSYCQGAESAWNYQQKKIDELEQENKRLVKSLQRHRRFILQERLARDFNKFLAEDEEISETLAKLGEKGER